MNERCCRKCGSKIGDLWKGWELCDKCGYRFNVEENYSPDDKERIMRIGITDREFEAINSAIDMISTAIQGGSDQFMEDYTPDVEALGKLRKKFITARNRKVNKLNVEKALLNAKNKGLS